MTFIQNSIARIITGKSRRAILEFLITHPNEEFSIRELSRETGLNINSVVKEVNNLLKGRIVNARKVGISKLVSINPESPLYLQLVQCFHKSYGAGRLLRQKFHAIDNIQIILLTHHFIYKKPKNAYDFDVLFVTKTKQGIQKIANNVQDIESHLNMTLVYTVLDEKEFFKRKKLLDPFVINPLSNEFVILKGRFSEVLNFQTPPTE